MKLRIAGIQLADSHDVGQNLAGIVRAIDWAVESGADILLTPEGSLSGYYDGFDRREVTAAVEEVVRAASGRGIGLALGTCAVERDGLCRNQIRFYGKDGAFLGAHSKILLCGQPDDLTQGEVNQYAAGQLQVFSFMGVTVGGLICNDLWANPEWTPGDDLHLTRRLAGMGARVIFHAVNCGCGDDSYAEANRQYHESNLRIRAKANGLWIATVNSSYPSGKPGMCAGGVVSPAGEWVCKAPYVGEQFYIHEITVD